MAVIVELNDLEQKLARYLGPARLKYNREAGHKRFTPQNSHSHEENEIDSVGAEIAFCKLFNVYPDLVIGQTPLFDALLRTGQYVDIKQTRVENGHLIVMPHKAEHPADLYVLMVGKLPRYRCAGYMRPEELFHDERIKNFGYGPMYAVKESELHQLAFQ
jgi:hypothetical protein